MSDLHETIFTCPHCGHQFNINVYDAVNVTKDPDLRDAVVSGDIFHHVCPHCQKDYLVQNDMLYVDMERRFMIWLSEHETGDSLVKFAEPFAKAGFKIRRCSTIKELSEKIQVFEDGLDDVLVELAKYDSFIDFINNKKGKAEDVTSVEYQHTQDDVMKINVRTGDKGASFLIPINMVQEELKSEADLYKVEDVKFPCINDKWIISLFEKENQK